jgi:hypothetical protein
MSQLGTEPASFRDPASTVFYVDGRVLRGLSDEAAKDFESLRGTDFFARRVAEGSIVATDEADTALLGDHAARWPLVLEHERVPFVSYPYEWTFSMLREAALLHLDLLLEALDAGMTMKDGYAYNLQWRGASPVFIDVPSFERDPDGGPWAGYRQFCQTMLYPLLLQAHKDVPFQPWLRGSINGIEAGDLRNLMSMRDLARAGVLKHVVLHAAMASRFGNRAQAMQADLKSAGFSSELTKATVAGLRKLVARLRWRRSDSNWADYRATCSYSDEDRGAKEVFVREAAATSRSALAWDLGCNDGAYSRLVAEHADFVVAVDSDPVVVDGLWRSLQAERDTRILPLVLDLADPSPGLGWRGRERRSFTDRARPDFVLALALLHHLVISANVPLPEVLDWLRSLGARMVVEFVHPDDPMAQRLLANKLPGQHDDYRVDVFEQLLAERFTVQRQQVLPSGTRTLYAVAPDA